MLALLLLLSLLLLPPGAAACLYNQFCRGQAGVSLGRGGGIAVTGVQSMRQPPDPKTPKPLIKQQHT